MNHNIIHSMKRRSLLNADPPIKPKVQIDNEEW